LALAVLAGASIGAQGKKPKAPEKWPGTVEFRCNLVENVGQVSCDPADQVSPDRVLGDTSNYALVPRLDGNGTAGAGIYSVNGEMHINLGTPSSYHLTLDFSQRQSACSTIYQNDCFAWAGSLLTLTTGTEMQSQRIDAAGNDISGGLLTLPIVGANGPSTSFRLRIDYTASDGLLYRVRFGPLDVSGATALNVRRVDTCQWEFDGSSARAGVWTSKVPAGQHKAVRVDYGLFDMPIHFTLRLANSAPVGCP
jgi:hypothetical protein